MITLNDIPFDYLVSWAKENGGELVTAEHMKIINDKRAKEKAKK